MESYILSLKAFCSSTGAGMGMAYWHWLMHGSQCSLQSSRALAEPAWCWVPP